MARLVCPRCAAVVEVAAGQRPVCTKCGFGKSPAPGAARPQAPRSTPRPPGPARPAAGPASGQAKPPAPGRVPARGAPPLAPKASTPIAAGPLPEGPHPLADVPVVPMPRLGAGPPRPATPVAPARRPRRTARILTVVAVAVLLVAGLVTAGLFVLRPHDDKPTAARSTPARGLGAPCWREFCVSNATSHGNVALPAGAAEVVHGTVPVAGLAASTDVLAWSAPDQKAGRHVGVVALDLATNRIQESPMNATQVICHYGLSGTTVAYDRGEDDSGGYASHSDVVLWNVRTNSTRVVYHATERACVWDFDGRWALVVMGASSSTRRWWAVDTTTGTAQPITPTLYEATPDGEMTGLRSTILREGVAYTLYYPDDVEGSTARLAARDLASGATVDLLHLDHLAYGLDSAGNDFITWSTNSTWIESNAGSQPLGDPDKALSGVIPGPHGWALRAMYVDGEVTLSWAHLGRQDVPIKLGGVTDAAASVSQMWVCASDGDGSVILRLPTPS